MNLGALKLAIILFGLSLLLKFQAWRHPAYRARLKEKNLTAQFIARDEEIGRWFRFTDGKVTSGSGVLKDADVTRRVQERRARRGAPDAADQLARPDQRAEGIPAHRAGRRRARQLVRADRDDGADRRLQIRHADAGRLDALLQHDQWRAGVRHREGRQDRPHDADRSRRQTTAPFTIEARGMKLTPPRKTTLAPHGKNAKSIVYSPDRLLYPMKRVDFDPNGARNPQNRGKSGYVRISWDEALKIVSDEIKRQKTNTARAHRGVARLAPHLGQHRLLPLGAVPFRQRGRHDARAPQSRFTGRAGTGARCITGATRFASASRRPTARSRTACRTAT